MSAFRAFLVGLATATFVSCTESSDPLVIGLTGFLTEPTGQSARRGAELAISQINQRGGVRGRRLELFVLDDRGQPATAVQNARRFQDAGEVLAVVGHSESEPTLAAASVYDSDRNPLVAISPTASSRDLGERGGASVFRACPDDMAHAEALAESARHGLGIRQAATLYHNDSDSRAMAAAFRAAFVDNGGTLLAEDPFSEVLPSFEPYLTRAAARGSVEALFVVGGEHAIDAIIATLDSVGLDPAILGKVELLRYRQEEGEGLEGALLSAPYSSRLGDDIGGPFVTSYRQAYGGRYPDYAAAGAFDIVHLIARAIREAGANRSAIRNYISGIGVQSDPFEGVSGTIAFDEHGNLRRTSVEVGIVADGTLVPVPER